ncbi:MAG: toll/interleukin-1 receptor domain-containing protein [Burkholderiales bacterium]
MRLLDRIDVRGAHARRIELLQGDMTALAPGEGFDLLVVSAFPGDYTPTPGSLIGALQRKGLSVQALSQDMAVDLRDAYASWVSNAFDMPDADLRFHRVLCFEPRERGRPPERVGDIFRALTPILAEAPEIRTVALPLIATGDQGYDVDEMLTPLLDAAIQWLERGLPLEALKIVTRSASDANDAAKIFSARADRYGRRAPAPPPFESRAIPGMGADVATPITVPVPAPAAVAAPAPEPLPPVDFDVFISYARENAPESEALEKALRQSRPDLRIFVDRKEIDIGAAWQPEIFETLDRCRKVVALLSPAYLGSKVCKEEFNIAWIRGRETGTDVIFPVYLYTTALPTYMKYHSYVDCREGDAARLSEASTRLLAALDRGGETRRVDGP